MAPYSDIYGGAILNATINLYAYATIEPLNNGKIIFDAVDRKQTLELKSKEQLDIDGNLDLAKGIYNRIVKQFTKQKLSFKLTTYVDAPPGSGLGSSSTLVVSILGAFAEWLKLPLGEYEIARLAWEIERVDLKMAGGKQDQYAATFGGVNFMEFYEDNKVIVNPLRIRPDILNELSYNIILYYTQTSRYSSSIIEKQADNIKNKAGDSLEATHNVKKQAVMMKEAILKGELDSIGNILNFGWENKKKMAAGISNPEIDKIYNTAIKHGATGGKISGAGGGGFMFFYCPGNSRFSVQNALEKLGGYVLPFEFNGNGLTSWTI